MNAEIATINENLPTAIPKGSWGGEQASSKDMLIPRLYLMQDLSDLVKKGKAKTGSIVNATTSETIATTDEPLEVIPILTFGEWLLYDVVKEGGRERDVYAGKTLVTKDNENWANEDVVDGKLMRRVRQINFLLLLPKYFHDLPFLVSFRKTSMMAGRKLSTHFQVSGMKGKPAASQVFKLNSTAMTRKGYNFFGFEVEPGRATTEKELAQAYHWYQLFNRGGVKVEEETSTEDAPF